MFGFDKFFGGNDDAASSLNDEGKTASDYFDLDFDLGDGVKDVVTGFEGTVVTITDYYKGALRAALQPQGSEDDPKPELEWFDTSRLRLVESHRVVRSEVGFEESAFKKLEDRDWKKGDRVKDSVAGFEGILGAVADHLYGCSRIGIKAETLTDDNETIDDHFFSIDRIQFLESLTDQNESYEVRPDGGPEIESGHKVVH